MSYFARRIRTARLLTSAPDTVYAELKEYGAQIRDQILGHDEELEAALFTKNDPLINLGLAQFGHEVKILAQLYELGCQEPSDPQHAAYLRGLRLACVSNEIRRFMPNVVEIVGEERFNWLIREEEGYELEAIFSNRNLGDELLEELFQKSGPFEPLDEKRYRVLIQHTASNPRLSYSDDDDHGPDIGSYGIQRALRVLISNTPVTKSWAHALLPLLERLDKRIVSTETSIAADLARWAEMKNRREDSGYYLDLPIQTEVRILLAALYGKSHQVVQPESDPTNPDENALPTVAYTLLGSAKSTDIAERCAYYANAELSEKEMDAGFDRDGDAYLFAALRNDSLLLDKSKRRRLQCEHLNADFKPLYTRQCARLAERYAWFNPEPVACSTESFLFAAREPQPVQPPAASVADIAAIKSSLRWLILIAVVVAISVWLK